MSRTYIDATFPPHGELVRRIVDTDEYRPSGIMSDILFELRLVGTVIPLTREQYHLILTKVLPPEKLVWSVNPGKGDIFYSPDYREWSVKPHPAHLVGGNIYHETKEGALEDLRKQLENKADQIRQRADRELKELVGHGLASTFEDD